jgi:xylulose-5-phosphate/fructose-6-phosphate phosphoketolase
MAPSHWNPAAALVLTINAGALSIKFALCRKGERLIHRLTYRRTNHHQLHVRGYKEEGTTTPPSDMVVLNELDRFRLVGDVIDRVPHLGARAAYVQQSLRDKLRDHRNYIRKRGEDMPEIRNWKWGLTRSV